MEIVVKRTEGMDEQMRSKLQNEARKHREDGMEYHQIGILMADSYSYSSNITYDKGKVIYCFGIKKSEE